MPTADTSRAEALRALAKRVRALRDEKANEARKHRSFTTAHLAAINQAVAFAVAADMIADAALADQEDRKDV